MPPVQLRCRDLRPGDLLLKLNAGNPVNVGIELLQRATGHLFPEIVHAGVLFDPFYIVEASGEGVHANDLRVGNAPFEYIAFRCTTPTIADGAGTYAKVLLDIHARQHAVPYNLAGALWSLVAGPGKASTPAQMDKGLDDMLRGHKHPYFCSQFVVAVFQFAAEQNGKAASTLFDALDAMPPSRLASMLLRSQAFTLAGYLTSNVR